MMRSWILGSVVTVCVLIGSPTRAGEADFPALDGPYFGQQVPGLEAQPFAPGLISLRGRYEFALSFSPAGDELLFTQQVPDEAVSVFHSRIEGNAWTEPVEVRLSGGAKKDEMEAFFTPDGKRIFFAPYDEGMDVRIWSVEVGPDGWGNPRELPSPVADDPAFYPTMSNKGILYYTNLAARKIYHAEIDGQSVGSVEDAGLEFGGHAFIAPDESFVLVDARQEDSLGDSDIYVAFRESDGSWGRPLNLGAEVNSEFSETCPSLSSDGKYLFFSRYNEPDEVSDIYWIDGTVIDRVRDDTNTSGAEQESPLYPPLEPLRTGYFSVSDTHELYWEVSGNPDGIPVIALHGGPGGRAGPEMRQFFDPERFYMLLFDQRGAGRSRPAGEWRDNTTQLLVGDINKLRKHVGIEGKAILFGGSWGTTLALAYAETHPDLVAGMLLRGVFLATREDIDYFYHGGAAAQFPDAWERLRSILPDPERLDYPRQLFEMATSEDPETSKLAIDEWALYEIRMVSVSMTDELAADIIEQYADALMPFSVLENFYMMNGCFLEDRQLLRNADRIAHVPTYIVHGRFDTVCRPKGAWQLAQRLENVHLEITANAGHSQNEPGNLEALVRGGQWLGERILLKNR